MVEIGNLTVKVLVGTGQQGPFSGFWAQFEGKEVSSYENDGIVYTLYECTHYTFDAYRVYISDERDHKALLYELLPEYPNGEQRRASDSPYNKGQLAEHYPRFLKHIDYPERVPVVPIDPPTS